MLYGVTAATGHLGRLAIRHLLDSGVAPGDVVALVRDPARAAGLAELGVQVRHADYDLPATLGPAFDGVDRLLFISGSELAKREVQHGNVVDAAVAAGVGLLAYTSILHADDLRLDMFAEHPLTEAMIRRSGLRHALLLHGWYVENYTAQLPQHLATGAVLGAAGEGRISAATRDDFAAADVAVLTGPADEDTVYELGGDDAFTLGELAAAVTRLTGRDVVYRDLPEAEYAAALAAAGLPRPVAEGLAQTDTGIARGDLFTASGDLSRLIGRPTTPWTAAVEAAVRGTGA